MFGKKEGKLNEDQKLSQEKSAQLDEAISQNIVVHKMPKNYKAGTFSYDEYFGKSTAPEGDKGVAPEVHAKSKKTGIVIMVVGLVVIGLLAYGAFAYLKNPDLLNIGSLFQKKTTVPAVNTLVAPVVNTPVVVPTTTVEMPTTTIEISTTTEVTSTPEVIVPTNVVDTDADGLSDAEEAILGTDVNVADSDGDKYNDLTEFIGGYNPAGSGKLASNANIQKYSNATYKYSILYPKSWKLDQMDKGASVIFTAADQSFVQVVTQANEKKLAIKEWYATEFGNAVLDSQLVKFNNWEGVRSVDGLIVYLTDKNMKNIYIISYTPVSDQVLSYNNIFEAMIRSFTIDK